MDARYNNKIQSHTTYPMSSVDHAWLRMDSPVNPMVINAVFTFKTPIKTNTLQQLIQQKFCSIDRFRCRAEGGMLGDHWQECALDTDYHLPVDLRDVQSNLELQAVATEFINKPLDSDRPLWRFLYLPNYRQGAAMVLRIHHAYADGMALMKVLLSMMDEGGLIKQFEDAQKQKHSPPAPSQSSILKRLQPFVPGNGKWLETLQLVDELTTELLKLGLSTGEENIFKTPGLCGKKQLVWTEPLKLHEVKTIAKAHQAKVNDVLLGSVGGAFRRYMKSMNELSAWSELRTLIPVDLRSRVKAEDLGNYFGLVFLSLPLGIEDPIERSRELNKRMMALKNSKQAWLVFQLLQLSGYLPDIAEKELIRLFSSKASAVMTNVPGPAFPLHFAGSELEQILFWVPQSGSVGVGVSILTYNNAVQFGLMTDKQLVSEPEQIIDCFNSEFESLLLETLMTVPWPT